MKLNCLIVCYSCTGNTHTVAAALQKLTGGKLLDIWPRQPYPMSYKAQVAQARREIAMHYYPSLLPIDLDPDGYELIFVGSPNWCSSIAPPLASFLAKYKLAGKTLVPFCSHGGGGSGRIQQDIRRLCPQADVKPVISLEGDGGAALEQLLSQRLQGLGLYKEKEDKE